MAGFELRYTGVGGNWFSTVPQQLPTVTYFGHEITTDSPKTKLISNLYQIWTILGRFLFTFILSSRHVIYLKLY